MDFARLEHDIRRVPGVVACQLTPSDAIVLVGPDADPVEVQRRVELLLVSAANAPALKVLGGRAPILPFRRRHRGLVAVTAGAAALAAAGVAAAVTGVVAPSTSNRPSLGTAAAAGPPATVPRRTTDAGVPSLRVEHDGVEVAAPTEAAPSGTADVQSGAQLATLGSPTLLVLPLPAPAPTSDAAPAPQRPRRHAPVPRPDGGNGTQTASPAAPPASPPAPDATSAHDGSAVAAAPPPPPPSPPTLSSTIGDTHDNDHGEHSSDSNGHDEKGPQGHAYGQASGGDGGRPGR